MLEPTRPKLNPFNSDLMMLKHDTAVYHVQCREKNGAYHVFYAVISNTNRDELVSSAYLAYDPKKTAEDGDEYFDSFEALAKRVFDDWSFLTKRFEEYKGKVISIVWRNHPLTFELFRKAMENQPFSTQKTGPRFKDLNTLNQLSRLQYSKRITGKKTLATIPEEIKESCIKGCQIFFEIMEARNKLFHPEKVYLVQKTKIPSNAVAVSVDGEVPTFYDRRMYGTGIRVQSLFNGSIIEDYCYYSPMPLEGVPEEGKKFNKEQVSFPDWATFLESYKDVIIETRKVIKFWTSNYPSLVIVKCPFPVEDGLFKDETSVKWIFPPGRCIDASTLQMITPHHPLDPNELHNPHYDASHALQIVMNYIEMNKDYIDITPPMPVGSVSDT